MNSIRPCWKCWTANSLMFRWEECDGKPVRVWSLKIGAAIEHAVAAVKDEVRAVGPVRRWRIGLHNRYEDHSGGPVDCRPQPPQAHLIAACSVPAAAPAQPKFE